MDHPVMSFSSPGEQLQIGILIYPGMTLLDLAGPQAALGLHGITHLFWKNLQPVMTDSGVAVMPTTVFSDGPSHLDVLFVPGGLGTNAMMLDKEVLDFLSQRGRTTRYITSVCSGSLITGAAGLLDGYKATTHWACFDALESLGVEAVHARVVADRNRFSGGGVTAGIDFGLTLLAALRGEQIAKVTQLAMEYDPEPPFHAGTPEAAGPELTAIARAMMGDELGETVRIAQTLRRARELAA